MSKIPEVFAIFEQKLAHVLSFTVVPLKSKDLKNALEEILTYFSGIVERASKAESRIAELEAAQRWIPVSESLPEVGKVVHVIDMNDIGSHLCNLYETAVLVEMDGNKRFGFIGHSGWDTSDVTHWMYAMPLPTPPEVQE